MKAEISLPLKAFSINSMFHKNRSWTTKEYKDWSAQVFFKLANYEKTFEDLRNFFDPKKHGFAIDLKFYYPSNILYTKSGSLSARAHDISNIEKPLIDLLFLPTFFEKSVPYGCKNLNIDDKFIIDMRSKKLPAEEHRIDIEIQVVSI